jgi:hypothetical protein
MVLGALVGADENMSLKRRHGTLMAAFPAAVKGRSSSDNPFSLIGKAAASNLFP